jgi:hypothetical protein
VDVVGDEESDNAVGLETKAVDTEEKADVGTMEHMDVNAGEDDSGEKAVTISIQEEWDERVRGGDHDWTHDPDIRAILAARRAMDDPVRPT